MNPSLRLETKTTDLSEVAFTITGISNESASGFRLSFENATHGRRIPITSSSTSDYVAENYIYTLPGQSEVKGTIDLSGKDLHNYASLSVYLHIEQKQQDQYVLAAIAHTTISVPRKLNLSSVYAVSLEPAFVQYGDEVSVRITAKENSDVWVNLNNHEYKVKIGSNGIGTITLSTVQFARSSNSLQEIRVYIAGDDMKQSDSGCVLKVVPYSYAKVATAASTITPSNLEIASPSSVDFQYPFGGAGEQTGCAAVELSPTGDTTFGHDPDSEFARVNSYSCCLIAPNCGLVAVASQDKNLLVEHLPADRISEAQASRIYVLETHFGNQYSTSVRTARVLASNVTSGDCSDGVIKIKVDEDIWADTNLQYIWIFTGDLRGRKFVILSGSRNDEIGIWYAVAHDQAPVSVTDQSCFDFVAYESGNYTFPGNLNKIQPLPAIVIDGEYCTPVNPQIATNSNQAPAANKNIYVVTEASVAGVPQLFFYSFNLETQDSSRWHQLTFSGENKNPRILCDEFNNLHVVWESSRCEPGQIYYGVLGPSSRAVMNETFVSALDKQAELIQRINNNSDNEVPNSDPASLTDALVTIGTPTPLNLRDTDEYGAYLSEAQWSTFTTSGGTASAVDDGTVNVSGNPSTAKFAVFGSLRHNESGIPLDSSFSQFSYQISFDLHLTSGSFNSYTPDEINDLYVNFREQFVALGAADNVGLYLGSKNNKYTVGNPQYVYDRIIPIVGSFKCPGIFDSTGYTSSAQLKLRHLMLAVVPEKVRFLATNIQSYDEYHAANPTKTLSDYTQYIQNEYYTGRFKLALITETTANLDNLSATAQKGHIVRMIGDFAGIANSHNYKVAIHYSKLREDHVDSRSEIDTLDASEQNLRFSGDVIIALDNTVVAADSFVPDFSDSYYQFDIGFGCAVLGEYRPMNVRAYDGTLNANLSVSMAFTNIAVGPHSIVPRTGLTFFARADRNVSHMYIASSANELNSMEAYQEAYGLSTSSSIASPAYDLSFGQEHTKNRLSQIPITFSGRNTSPSLALDRCGKPHVAFQSNRKGRWEIFYTSASNVARPFRFDTQITNSPGSSLMPSIALDGDGRRLITWHDTRDGVYQVYAARSSQTQDCGNDRCLRDRLADDFGFVSGLSYFADSPYYYPSNPFDAYEYFPDIPTSGSLCNLTFRVENTSPYVQQLHFIAQFFSDEHFTSLAKVVDSRLDISNWFVDGVQLPYDGVTVQPGQTVTVSYDTSSEDDLHGQLYYVEINSDNKAMVNGAAVYEISPLKQTILFYCPVLSQARCSIPCVYTNHHGGGVNAHFRVTVYKDETLSEVVMSADSSLDQRKWLQGSTPFPAGGVQVDNLEMVSVVYNPDFLPLDMSQEQNAQTVTSLLCNTTYWVTVESYVNGSYTVEETFALECRCSQMNDDVSPHNQDAQEWECSGQGGTDIRITNTQSPALFCKAAGSVDGIVYFTWEDQRVQEGQSSIYYAVWDGKTDTFYCQSQGFFDTLIAQNGIKPNVLVTPFQYAALFYTDGNAIYRSVCSLYQTPPAIDDSTQDLLDTLLYPSEVLSLSGTDLNCVRFDVATPDVVRQYHMDSSTPIALVENCRVRLEVVCPHGAYAVRFKNENETEWNPWIPVSNLATVPGLSSSSSGAGIPIEQYLKAYAVADDRFIAQWILSPGSGNKTVLCEVMTYFGRTPTITRNIIARYREATYRVEFFLGNIQSSSSGVPVASMYQGYPIIGNHNLTVQPLDVTSITAPESSISTVFIRVTFDDADYLAKLLELNTTDKFYQSSDLTFDVVLPGKTLRGLPLVKSSDVYPTYDPILPNATAGFAAKAVYTGSFPIKKADGFDNIDGLATVVVNVPSPCIELLTPDVCDVQRRTTEDIIDIYTQQVNAVPVSAERFRLNYNKDIACSFVASSCGVATPAEDIYYDDKTFPPPATGPVSCEVFDWALPKLGEPCLFFRNAQNALSWVQESPVFEMDFTDTRVDYLKFNSATTLDGILIMVHSNETVSSDTIACAGTGGVIFTVPNNTIVFRHSTPYYYCSAADGCHNGSVEKTFKINTTTLITIPAGTNVNNGTDGGATWALPSAKGIIDNGLTTDPAGALVTDFTNSVSRRELLNRGFLSNNGILRFKFVFIPSGAGFVDIVGMTCGAACEA